MFGFVQNIQRVLYNLCMLSMTLYNRYLMGRLPFLPVISCIVDSAAIYINVVEILKYYFTPLPRSSSFIGWQRWQPIKMGHSLYIRGRGGAV
jgi:hypothetical protein